MEESILEQIKPGARVKVWEKIKEKGKERKSSFEGIVLARKHGKEAGATFTVRTVLQDVGVEKIYPIHSPNIAKIEIISSPKKIHRSKLYYLRGLSSKKIRDKLRKKVKA
ncbi:MAG: 50S ribosomal protein L19 [Patescibacteria group bacterium]|nr:50S ribosomal protein L19 [Patescibacteria group bacterium]